MLGPQSSGLRHYHFRQSPSERLLCGHGWRGCHRDNDIDLEPNELGRAFCIALIETLCLAGRTPNLDRLASKACALPIIMPKRVARRVARTSSLANSRSALD
jgi:hypothetical protein